MQFDRPYLKSVIQQIVSKATDHSHSMAGIANERLLSHRTQGGDHLGLGVVDQGVEPAEIAATAERPDLFQQHPHQRERVA